MVKTFFPLLISTSLDFSSYLRLCDYTDFKGGKFEDEMAMYIEKLLAETPIPSAKPVVRRKTARELCFMPLPLFKANDEKPRNQQNGPHSTSPTADQVHPEPGQLSTESEPLASPAMQVVSAQYHIGEKSSPFPGKPFSLLRQQDQTLKIPRGATGQERAFQREYSRFIEETQAWDQHNRRWEASQKEPIIEIPIRRTKQYFAIAQEMEEYSEKRAAQALGGIDGQTMMEKEQGIMRFLAKFGGLRSMGGRQRFQGPPPWEKTFGIHERKVLRKSVRKAKFRSPRERVLARISKQGKRKAENGERVIWKFEDVTWVKQRTVRPRKRSYVGLLDERVRLESGVRRYGPNGIGSGSIEGVGGIKQVILRGLDGKVRLENGPKTRSGKKREIVV